MSSRRHACCRNAGELLFYVTSQFCWYLDTGNTRLVPVYFCPFCGVEL